ncbi:MAG: tRNA pseudouridine(38-40) synthase TruA, partial [Fimbriimonadaceae bacterium]|nr:tRNA pseudouridine(38-40) synthase TruA [Fimbriimonadaceae bacterium]
MSTDLRRIKLTVAYDGTDFSGFAAQKGTRTVHGILTDTIRRVSGEENEITGASRTDGGAHARGQVVHFDTRNPMPLSHWPKALNMALPSDISVVKAEAVPSEFHSRFWADRRWYRYAIKTGLRDPRRARFCHQHHGRLDAEAMNRAAQRLTGEHDFFAFSQLVPPEMNTVRTLHRLQVSRVRDEVRIDIIGTAFVRGMMRRISGALWEIGRGARDEQTLDDLLRFRTHPAGQRPVVLPAKGLTLMKVFYGRHPK